MVRHKFGEISMFVCYFFQSSSTVKKNTQAFSPYLDPYSQVVTLILGGCACVVFVCVWCLCVCDQATTGVTRGLFMV